MKLADFLNNVPQGPLQVVPTAATVAGRDSHPLETMRLPRHTEKCGLRHLNGIR